MSGRDYCARDERAPRVTPEKLLADEKFAEVWAEYLEWRKKCGRKFPVSDRVIKSGLRTLAAMGSVAEAIRSLDHCMLAGYRGIFPAPQIRQPQQPWGAIPDAPARRAQKPMPAAPRATPAEEAALQDYKEQAEWMSEGERGDLMAKARDTLPGHLQGQLAARISILNSRDNRQKAAPATLLKRESEKKTDQKPLIFSVGHRCPTEETKRVNPNRGNET